MEQLKTGTTTVGLVCKDGIVLAADKRATAGNLIVDKETEKVLPIFDKFAVTIAGSVSDIQYVMKVLKAELQLKKVRLRRELNSKESANLLSNLVYGNIRKMSTIQGISHFLFGGYDVVGNGKKTTEFSLYDIFPDGTISKITDFISTGSGSVMAYGVLETLYDQKLTVEEGVELVTKAIGAAIQRDAMSGNGIDIVTITKDGVKKVVTKKIDMKFN